MIDELNSAFDNLESAIYLVRYDNWDAIDLLEYSAKIKTIKSLLENYKE